VCRHSSQEVEKILITCRQVIEGFGVSEAVASLGLALYVLGCTCRRFKRRHKLDADVPTLSPDGIGPLLFSPLSEIPSIGRNPIYISTFAVFIVLSVGAAVCENFAGFLVLRFLQGFFGSPCLATGAASLSDMVDLPYIKSPPTSDADN